MTDDLTPAGESAVRLALTTADLRRKIAALTADNDDLRDRLDAIEAACDDADRRGQMLGSQAVRRLVRGTR